MPLDPVSQRAYQRRWIADRKAAWLAEHGPCVQCGSVERLEVDHIDPTLKVRARDHAIWSYSAEHRAAELAKCQVLCHACHLEKTSARRRALVQHGTTTMYSVVGCRCDPCRTAKAAYQTAWRAARRRFHSVAPPP